MKRLIKDINTLPFINLLNMTQPESKKLVLDWVFINGQIWFKPRKVVNEIHLNRSLIYSILKTFHNKKILEKTNIMNGRQNTIKYKLDRKFIANLLYMSIDSLELILDVVDPYV